VQTNDRVSSKYKNANKRPKEVFDVITVREIPRLSKYKQFTNKPSLPKSASKKEIKRKVSFLDQEIINNII